MATGPLRRALDAPRPLIFSSGQEAQSGMQLPDNAGAVNRAPAEP